jgi:hypothetical protein
MKEMNTYSKIVLIAFDLLAPDIALAQAQRSTATEVFQLRSECPVLSRHRSSPSRFRRPKTN